MKIKKLINNEFVLLLFFICLFIGIRTIYYQNLFVFVHDQVSSSTKVLELWQTKSLSLIGPPLSFLIEGRQIFFGGISYYIQMFFLLIGRFDPFWSTYAFMVFCGLMIVPLYFGVKKLINGKVAILTVILYSLLPFYIESTIALWNPYFKFALLPILLYLMGLFKEKKNSIIFFLISFLNGVFFQLHYMYIFTVFGFFIYYFISKKNSLKFLLIFIIGFCLGFSNLIFFELRHNFYNLQTIIFYLSKPKEITGHWFSDYYLLSESLFILLIVFNLLKKQINNYVNITILAILLVIGIPYVTTIAKTKQYPKNWYYKDELKTFGIIKNNLATIKDFNIFEFYDTKGSTQKYFLKKDNIKIDYDNYLTNKYLYVLYTNNQYMKDPSYEVNTFQPSEVVKIWTINEFYKLYLLTRK